MGLVIREIEPLLSSRTQRSRCAQGDTGSRHALLLFTGRYCRLTRVTSKEDQFQSGVDPNK